jgi:hypothetical protein
MKQRLKSWLYVAVVLCMSVSCKKQDRTTVVFGTVKDDAGKPIAGLEMNLYGEKGLLGSRATLLKTAKTDVKGEYSITTEIPKDYHSGNVICNFFNDPNFYGVFDSTKGDIFFNGQNIKDCCSVSVGQKNQYDWVLVRK